MYNVNCNAKQQAPMEKNLEKQMGLYFPVSGHSLADFVQLCTDVWTDAGF